MNQTQTRPVQPSIRSWERRPGVLCLAPAWALVIGLPLAVLVVAGWCVGRDRHLEPELLGIVVTGWAFAVGWELQVRRASHQQVADAVGRLLTAWERMKLASGIGWAIETNLREALDGKYAKRLGRRKANVKRIYDEVRRVEPILRPTSLHGLVEARRARYNTVRKANQDIIGVFDSKRIDGRRCKKMCLPLVDDEALTRLMAATRDWEEALASTRSAVARSPVLDRLVVRCDALVRHWWVFAQNDPYYRNPQAESGPRNLAFDQAREAVESLRDGVATRSIGQRTWRVVLLRLMVGRRVLATLDAQKDVVP